jgi:hypothetical protein
MTAVAENPKETLTIPAPNLRTIEVKITGEAPYMMHRFSKKGEIQAKQEQGSTAKGKKKHAARDFATDFEAAKHVSMEGWIGIPAASIRAAMISACRLVGFQMTKAKLSVFCLADGMDRDDGAGLVRINGEPEQTIMYCRNETGVVDLRARPMWRKWDAVVRLRYDADQFTSTDVLNLLMRAGAQVGIGEGRPDSKKSAGMGYGTFTVEQSA